MKKLLFLIVFSPMIAKASIYNVGGIVLTDTEAERPTNVSTGTFVYSLDTNLFSIWNGTSWINPSSNKLLISSAAVSYLGVSSTTALPPTAVTYSSASLSYLGISSATALPASAVTYSSAALSYLGISSIPILSPTAMTYSSASVSMLGISSTSVDSLTKSSATTAYTALSTFTALTSSISVGYLGVSSAPVSELSKSSASLSYIGISSLTASNQVMTLSSSNVSNLAISSFNVLGTGPNIVSPYGAGYTLTATTNTITVAGSSTTVTIGAAGTYLLFGSANIIYIGATFAASQMVTMTIYRQNNTPGIVAGTPIQAKLRVTSAVTDEAEFVQVPVVVYITANSNDVLSLHGSVSTIPSVGSLQANKASLLAVRIK